MVGLVLTCFFVQIRGWSGGCIIFSEWTNEGPPHSTLRKARRAARELKTGSPTYEIRIAGVDGLLEIISEGERAPLEDMEGAYFPGRS